MRRALQIILLLLLPASSFAQTSQCLELFSAPAVQTQATEEQRPLEERTPSAGIGAQRLQQTMERSEALIDLALEAKLLSRGEAKHLKEDMAELKSEKQFKEGHETFEHILAQWEIFIADAHTQLSTYNAMGAKEKKRWKQKMELPIYYATGHFIVFLETRSRKFNYGRMNFMLENMNARTDKTSLELYLYLMEKNARVFSSLKEFRRCKA